MAGKREKMEEIVSKLRQVKVLQEQGTTIAGATSTGQREGERGEGGEVHELVAALWRVQGRMGKAKQDREGEILNRLSPIT